MVLYTVLLDAKVAEPPETEREQFYDALIALWEQLKSCAILVTDQKQAHWTEFKRSLLRLSGVEDKASVDQIFELIHTFEERDRVIASGFISPDAVTCPLAGQCELACRPGERNTIHLAIASRHANHLETCGSCGIPIGVITRINSNQQWKNMRPDIHLGEQLPEKDFASQVWEPFFQHAMECNVFDRNLGFGWNITNSKSIIEPRGFTNYKRGLVALAEQFGKIRLGVGNRVFRVHCGFRPQQLPGEELNSAWRRFSRMPIGERLEFFDLIGKEMYNILEKTSKNYNLQIEIKFPRDTGNSDASLRHNRYIITNQAAMFIDLGVDWLHEISEGKTRITVARPSDYGLLREVDRVKVNGEIAWHTCRL